jgi:hypothetical protein
MNWNFQVLKFAHSAFLFSIYPLDDYLTLRHYWLAGIFFYRKESKIIFLEKIMEAVASVGGKSAVKVGINQAQVSGRIKGVSTFDVKGKRMHEAVVMIAAADAYSMPGAVAVQSSYRLGNPGDEVTVLVSVTGIPNSWTDKTTGQVKESANVRLVVVE